MLVKDLIALLTNLDQEAEIRTYEYIEDIEDQGNDFSAFSEIRPTIFRIDEFIDEEYRNSDLEWLDESEQPVKLNRNTYVLSTLPGYIRFLEMIDEEEEDIE